MTITHKIHVNGNYEATIKHTIEGGEGRPQETIITVGPNEEKVLPFRHGLINCLEITEKYLGETAKPADLAKEEADDAEGDEDEDEDEDAA